MKRIYIKNLQLARVIIKTVGERHQYNVLVKLRGAIYYYTRVVDEQKANEVIQNMELEYCLAAANILVIDKYDELPQYLKEWIDKQ